MTPRLRVLASRLWSTLRRRRQDREFTEELTTHLSLLVEEGLAAGLTPGEARRAALHRLGRPELLAELHRDVRGVPLVECKVYARAGPDGLVFRLVEPSHEPPSG